MASRKVITTKTVVHAPTVRTFTTWTADRIRSAELQADGGSLRGAADVCEWLLKDERVAGTLSTRVDALIGLVPSFEAAGDKRRSNVAVKALDAQEDWFEAYPESELRLLHLWGLLLGIAPGRHYWRVNEDHGGRVLPYPEFWPAQTLAQDQRTRQWSIYDSANTKHDIAAGDGTWLLHTPYGKNRPWAMGLWRPLAPWVLLKELARQDWSRHSEKASTLVATSPEGSTKKQRDELVKQLYEVGGDAIVALAAGYDLKLLEVEANTKQIYEAQIQIANAAIAILIRGGDLTTQVDDKGSRAAAEVQERKGDNAKLKFDASTLATTLNQQSLVWWAEFNFGDRKLAPWPEWPVEPPADKAKRAETEKVAAEGLDLHIKLGFAFDPKKYKDAYDLDYLTTWQKPEPVVPPAPGVPPGDDDKDEDGKPKKPPPKPKSSARFAAHLGKLLAFARAAGQTGKEDAQAYADELAAEGLKAFEPMLAAVLAAIEQEIDAATGYEDLRERLQARYQDLDPHEIGDLVESVTVLAEMAGRLGVTQDA